MCVCVCVLLLWLYVQLLSQLKQLFNLFIFKSSGLYVLSVRVLLLEHSHKVISTSSVYLIKLVLDVRRLFHLGGEKGHTNRAMQAYCGRTFHGLLIIMRTSLLDVLYFNLIYFLVI